MKNIPHITSENIKAPHGFFGTQGGVSEDLYRSLNCGPGSNDNSDHVKENRARVATTFDCDNLLTCHQTHSNICVYVDLPFQERPQADALVTDVPGLLIGALTADCAPILFCGEKIDGSLVVGAAHAGWRGAIGGIIESTINVMKEKGAAIETIKAAIGPCIGKQSYEVGEEFREEFINNDASYAQFFKQKETKYLFDLSGFVQSRLITAGVKSVSTLDQDTYALKNQYFSHRRNTHSGHTDYGRQVSVISL